MYFLKQLRKQHGYTQQDMADKLNCTRVTYNAWENSYAEPGLDVLRKISKIFNVPADVILNGTVSQYSNRIFPIPASVKRPRLGEIACGTPILCEENFDGYDEVPTNIQCDFTLRAKGNSMIGARINDGDIVYIRSQNDCDNRDIAVVYIDGEATLKRVIKNFDGTISMLVPENPKYDPIPVKPDMDVRIIGVAVGFVSKL